LSGPVAIITNGGGCGVLAADACAEFNVPLAKLNEKTLKSLDSSGVIHPSYSRRNPLDIIGDALPVRYEKALDAVLSDSGVGGVIVIQTLQTMTASVADANLVLKCQKKYSKKPIVCCFMGGPFTKPGADVLKLSGIPNFNDPRRAARVLSFRQP
jgi:acetyltransferase